MCIAQLLKDQIYTETNLIEKDYEIILTLSLPDNKGWVIKNLFVALLLSLFSFLIFIEGTYSDP